MTNRKNSDERRQKRFADGGLVRYDAKQIEKQLRERKRRRKGGKNVDDKP